MEAFQEAGIDPSSYLKARNVGESLPWSFIDPGIDPDYLVTEWQKAQTEESTLDCRSEGCTACGVCDFKDVRPRLVPDDDQGHATIPEDEPVQSEESIVRRFRLQYAKVDRMRFLGHQDLIRLFQRAFRRATLRLDYSRGFHPHPKLRFSPPLALGVESVTEYLDFDLVDENSDADQIASRLNANLPSA